MVRMVRFVIAALLIYLIWYFWKKASRRAGTKSRSPREIPGEMISCSRCGTFILRSEALTNGGDFYCSEGCRKGN